MGGGDGEKELMGGNSNKKCPEREQNEKKVPCLAPRDVLTENRKLSPRCWNGPGLPVITSVPVYSRPQSHNRNISSTLATLPACVSSGAKVGPRHALHPSTDSRAEMSWTDILLSGWDIWWMRKASLAPTLHRRPRV